MTSKDTPAQELQYVLDPSLYEPELREAYKKWEHDLLVRYEAACDHAIVLPEALLFDLGKTLNHDHTPLGTITTVLNRWNHPNFMDEFEAFGNAMLQDVKKSRQYTRKASCKIEFLRNEIAGKIVKWYKRLDL